MGGEGKEVTGNRVAGCARRLPLLRTLLAVLAVNLAGTGVLVIAGAGAAEQPAIRVSEGSDFSGAYGPIPLQNPVLPTAVAGPEPPDCALPVAFCDVIPVEVSLPADYDPELVYLFSTVELTWAQPPESNDLDLYFWTQDEEGHYVDAGGSATAAKPERGSTEARRYFIVVNNFSGSNDGYSLSVKVTVERLGEKPFELLEPPARPFEASTFDAGAPTGPAPRSGGSAFGAPPVQAPSGASPALGAPAAPGLAGPLTPPARADVDFAPEMRSASLVGAGHFGSQGAGSPASADLQSLAPAAPAARPVPAAVIVLWLGVLPLALLVLGAAWLLRRGRRQLWAA